jgi:restriction system protein
MLQSCLDRAGGRQRIQEVDFLAIPDFQSLMVPLLRLASDGAEHTLADSVAALASEFSLTPVELDQLNPSGRARTFYNRVAWASSYLRAALLLESTGRGRFKITTRGTSVLAKDTKRIDIPYLMQFPEFKAIRDASAKGPGSAGPAAALSVQTPEEEFESSYQSIRASVEQEVLSRVKVVSPAFFEQVVVDLIVAMGYGGSQADAGKAIGQSGDGGIDGVIKEDRLGLDTIYLQAKRWQGNVGRPVVQAFVGSLAGQHARRGVLITTSDFSPDARKYVLGIEQRIILIDGMELARLMFEFGVGVSPIGSPYVLKRVDTDFFDDV